MTYAHPFNAMTTCKWITIHPKECFKRTIQEMTKEDFDKWLLEPNHVIRDTDELISVWYGLYFRATK